VCYTFLCVTLYAGQPFYISAATCKSLSTVPLFIIIILLYIDVCNWLKYCGRVHLLAVYAGVLCIISVNFWMAFVSEVGFVRRM